MLNIIVLGSGLIPRGYGIAPRRAPFAADLKLIKLIVDTANLKPCMIHPETGATVPLTASNCDKMYKLYGEEKKIKNLAPASKYLNPTTAINVKPFEHTTAVNSARIEPTTDVKNAKQEPTTAVNTSSQAQSSNEKPAEEKKDEHIVINVNNNNKDEKKK